MKTTIVIDTDRGTVTVKTVAAIDHGEDPRGMVDAILKDAMRHHR
jgi:hypothetical protein